MRILIEILHGLGDTVCMLPTIKLVREQYPNAYIVVLTKFKGSNEIIKASNIDVDQILILDIYKNLISSFKMLKYLRSMRFDYAISSAVTPVQKAKRFMKAIQPKKWIGIQNKNLCYDALNDQYHFVEANLLAIDDFCIRPKDKIYPRLYSGQDSIDKITKVAGNINRKLIGICIGDADYSLKNRFLRIGKVYTRSWGIMHMTSLIQLLIKKDINVALIGGAAERHLLATLQKRGVLSHPQVINFVGETTIEESIALASICDMVVGVDTGMQHIAAATGTETISIFGPTNPLTHGAYANNAHFIMNYGLCEYQYCYGSNEYVNCPKQRVCLKSIMPNEVCEMIFNIISDGG